MHDRILGMLFKRVKRDHAGRFQHREKRSMTSCAWSGYPKIKKPAFRSWHLHLEIVIVQFLLLFLCNGL